MERKRDRRAYYRSHKEFYKQSYLARWHPCIDCGVLISPRAIRCRKCRGIISPPPIHIGEDCHNWQGKAHMKGYVFIKMRNHPRAHSDGYVPEHLLVWESFHKKPLPDGWIVHHLNGIKYDNRIENLQALPNHKHYFVLQAKAKRIQELEALIKNQLQLL